MTREEAKREIEKVFEPAFANYIIKALTDGATESDVEPQGDLISREAVLNTLDNMDKVLDENRTVEAYKDLLKECFKEFPPVEPQEWISVKKHGNPKEDGLYMVTVRGGFEETENEYVTTSYYIFDRGGWSVEDVDTEVTAWIPKPSPYKGE